MSFIVTVFTSLFRCQIPVSYTHLKQQSGLTAAPIIIADQIGTKPAPGVMATRPTTKPVEAPTRVGLPSLITSINIQDIIALALASAVVINAWAASPLAPRALPASVSYTHLDVYKRQQQAMMGSDSEICLSKDKQRQKEYDPGHTVVSVSYTHLDVYKRQT